ncbi:hypothetical protein ABE10_00365, partial [Bacillus toyonensis]|nr:hypothetical protein [Bacillus toyonensis]
PRGGTDLVERGVGLAESDVVRHRAAEQVGLLRDHDDRAPQVLRMQPAQVHAVEGHRAPHRVVETRHELGECGLARPRRPHQCDRLTGRDVELELGQDRLLAVVPESHVVKADRAPRLSQLDGPRRVRHARFLLQHAGDLLQRRGRRLVGVQEHRDLLHRREEVPHVENGREQHADTEHTGRHPDPAPEHDEGERQRGDTHERRLERAEQHHRATVHVTVVTGEAIEGLLVARLLAEGLHGTDAGHRLDELDDHLRADHARLSVDELRAAVEPAHQEHERDPGEGEDHPRLPVGDHERDEGEHAEEHPGHEVVQTAVQELADRVEVARLSGDDAARGVRLVELQAQPLRVQEDALAQIQQHGLRDARGDHDIPADQRRSDDACEQVHDTDHDRRHPVRPLHEHGQGLVEADPDEDRTRDLQRCGQDEHDG